MQGLLQTFAKQRGSQSRSTMGRVDQGCSPSDKKPLPKPDHKLWKDREIYGLTLDRFRYSKGVHRIVQLKIVQIVSG